MPEVIAQQPLSMPNMSSQPLPFPSPSTFNSFLFQNPSVNGMAPLPSLMLPAFSGMNLNVPPNPNGFAFPAPVPSVPSASPIPMPATSPLLPPIPAPEQQNKQPQPHQPDTGSITANFLKTYYNELHSNPDGLEKYYHVDANIDHDVQGFTRDTDGGPDNQQLGVFDGGVSFVDIVKIVDQKAVNNSILIRVNGVMRFEKAAARQFEQIFFLSKSAKGFWLIHNDIFWLIRPPGSVDKVGRGQAQQENRRRTANLRAVDESMVNKYYHDTSYQCFDNNLAVFIRPIPNTLTHGSLAALLETNIDRVKIAYIDVNYHKQFAFVYFQDRHSFEKALECREIFIDGASAQIQVKRSKNKPRTFGYPRRF